MLTRFRLSPFIPLSSIFQSSSSSFYSFRYYAINIKEEFDILPKHEQDKILQRLRNDIKNKRTLNNKQEEQKHVNDIPPIQENNSSSYTIGLLKLIIPCIGVFCGLHCILGYLKQQQPIVEAKIIHSDNKIIIYEYTIFNKTFRRLQQYNGTKNNLNINDIIQIHYLPKNPSISIYKPPLFYLPWIYSTQAKEVQYV